MSGALLSQKFAVGPQRSSARLGLPFAQYRATSATSPLATRLATLNVFISAEPNPKPGRVAAPYRRDKPDERYAQLDPTATQVGDYLVGSKTYGGPVETFFIAEQSVPAAIRLVECSRTFSFTRAPGDASAGLATAYAGATAANRTPLLTGWPGSCVQGTKGEAGPPALRLPGDVRQPWWTALLPAYAGVTLNMGDHATDDLARAYTVSSAELTLFGWRLTMMLAST